MDTVYSDSFFDVPHLVDSDDLSSKSDDEHDSAADQSIVVEVTGVSDGSDSEANHASDDDVPLLVTDDDSSEDNSSSESDDEQDSAVDEPIVVEVTGVSDGGRVQNVVNTLTSMQGLYRAFGSIPVDRLPGTIKGPVKPLRYCLEG